MIRTTDVVIYLKGLLIVIIISLGVSVVINSIKGSRDYLAQSLANEYFEIVRANARYFPGVKVLTYSVNKNDNYINVKFDMNINEKGKLYNYVNKNVIAYCRSTYSAYFSGLAIFIESYNKNTPFIYLNSNQC
ncbi:MULTISPECIES: hypothetical protein [Enterobacteriaceae]|uniref:hypothetical protein n=1 Tax=Enterobacteriaceae TaxID=543 RepID=UPI001157929F|nr:MULTISPECIES: hypothetical protein [Enterobacteriaceae]HBS4243097.1 hypothetical protein [Klebsiella quasipneumoniae subsp. quasipneumoniae]MBS2826120.1 hypothetical protein [Klebsiella pneumoniae]UFH12626.1 hypothetical protein LOX64_25460 [Klebsiella pneumoniae]UKW22709.1 hypothetical protein MBA36_23830 [Enterobacter cloacae]HBS6362376.1 hypothetical protein [Klebsiella pneumoniae]